METMVTENPSGIRAICYKAFYDYNSKLFVVVNDFLALLTIASIVVLSLETVTSLYLWYPYFQIIEYCIVAFFSLEYIGRIIATRKPASYIFSFFGIIDLVSILPTFFHVANLTPLKTGRMLRILRFLRMIRISKIIRARIDTKQTSKRESDIENYSSILKLNLEIYLVTLVTLVLLLGSLMYMFEHNNATFANLPISFLWILEHIFEGHSLLFSPITTGGIIVGLLARFVALILLGFLIHISGNVINSFILGSTAGPRRTLDENM